MHGGVIITGSSGQAGSYQSRESGWVSIRELSVLGCVRGFLGLNICKNIFGGSGCRGRGFILYFIFSV